jgi:hypothetical protein
MLPIDASQWRRSDATRWPCVREPLPEKMACIERVALHIVAPRLPKRA